MLSLLFNWEKCKILEIRKLYCSKTALGWGQGCFSNGFGSWRCRMSGFVVQGPKLDDRNSSELKNRLFPTKEHKRADLQKPEITHTLLFVLHFQQNRWMSFVLLSVIANWDFFSYSASRLTLSSWCWAMHESITFIIYRQESFCNSHLPFLVVL